MEASRYEIRFVVSHSTLLRGFTGLAVSRGEVLKKSKVVETPLK